MRKTPEQHLDELKEIAISRGGKLISKKYLGDRIKLTFSDAAGNFFDTIPSSIKAGTWSPYEGQVSEPSCRQAMNHLFNTVFEKTSSILNAKLIGRARALELDGYCKKLNIAFEYQGYPSHWKTTHRNYETTVERDLIKKEYCKKLGIHLIIIPPLKEVNNRWNSDVIVEHVTKAIHKFYQDIELPIPYLNKETFKLDLSNNNHCLKMLNRLKKIAEENKGRLITKKWKGTGNVYWFEDSNGIRFKMIASNILKKSRGWPKNPSLLMKTGADNILEMRKIAESNGGKLLSKKWFGNDNYYRFLFQDGREFKIKGSNIRLNGWPKDRDVLFYDNKYFFKRLKQLANQAGFKLLEIEWLGSNNKHRFLSSCNRIISMSPSKIKTEGFIKDLDLYFKSEDDYLNEIRLIAETNGGQLLEDKWLGNNIKHRFKFADGREFSIIPGHLKSQGWPQSPNNYFAQAINIGVTPQEKLGRLKNIAEENGGKLLEDKWLGYNKRHKFLFSDGREFSVTPQLIKAHGWPKGATYLFLKDEDYLEELRIIAENNKGKLITNTWMGNRSKYEFQFEDGRVFFMQPASLKNRGWPKDADKYFRSGKVKS